MRAWRNYRRKRKIRKTDNYQWFYREFWMEHEAKDWLPDWWRSYCRYARFAYVILALLGLLSICLGMATGSLTEVWHGATYLALTAAFAGLFDFIYRTSDLRIADQYALTKCGGLDETKSEAADAK